MRAGHYGPDTILIGHQGHLNGLLHGGGAVVYAWEDVVV
jgi:hypothetical protein